MDPNINRMEAEIKHFTESPSKPMRENSQNPG
jgi:hypothetical protein